MDELVVLLGSTTPLGLVMNHISKIQGQSISQDLWCFWQCGWEVWLCKWSDTWIKFYLWNVCVIVFFLITVRESDICSLCFVLLSKVQPFLFSLNFKLCSNFWFTWIALVSYMSLYSFIGIFASSNYAFTLAFISPEFTNTISTIR